MKKKTWVFPKIDDAVHTKKRKVLITLSGEIYTQGCYLFIL